MIDKYPDLVKELKKATEHESDGDTNRKWCSWYCQQCSEELEIRERMHTIQRILLRSTDIVRRIFETCGNLLSLGMWLRRPSVNAGEESSQIIIIIIIIII